jgi:hypothetical protein
VDSIIQGYQENLDKFKNLRKKYLLYPDKIKCNGAELY